MTAPWPDPPLRQIHRLLGRPGPDGLTDAQLLERFVAQRDEAAFEVLVWRHGPMALGVCRRILGNHHDAEDALQATLLVLARKAPAIARGGSVASWLFKVAHRVALRARAQALRKARHEARPAALATATDPRAPDPDGTELHGVLDEELRRLAEKYRAPVVLCYLEGLTNEEAARQLGCPVGTLKTRLAHARELLADRLRRRGLAGCASLVGGGFFMPAERVSAGLVSRAARAAVLVVSGQGIAAGAVSAQVAGLTEGALRAMTMVKVRLLAAAVAAGLAVAGTGVVSYRGLLAQPTPPQAPDAATRVEQIKSRIADLQEQLRHAEQEAARQKAQERAPKTVAVIFGDVPITRDQLAEHFLARLSNEQLQTYLSLRILEHACRRKGITVTQAEVDAAAQEGLKGFGDEERGFAALLRDRYKTLWEWKEDVVRPRLLAEKLCRERVRVTEKDLQSAFEARYGEKVECQVILWPRDRQQEAEREAEALRVNKARFELKAGTQPNHTLALTNGRMKPFGRHGTGNAELEKAAFRLRPGEVSSLVETNEGLALIKCLRRIPADSGADFEKERDALRPVVEAQLLHREMGRMMRQLREQARPQLLWTPRAASSSGPARGEGEEGRGR